ncbi:nucleoprotein TPR-like [Uloborus diversus]|uniref:nucleoprotein TPR-like n=1 Tax=Uloborus diversus TaxID=327109 RepID=UPI002409AF49|nr:nucleoprotein TPR-like [Uloborus diversus]
MEVCAKLENFLDDNELNTIPENVKGKISDQLTHLNQLLSELRNENEEKTAVLERQQFEFEKELTSSQQQLQEKSKACAKLEARISELEESFNTIQKQLKDLQKLHDSTVLELQTSKREKELLCQEKGNLTEQLEKRRAEIDKLNADLKSLLDQTTAANEAKFEAIAAAEEAKIKESNLQHQVRRLEQENELLHQQITDLNTELAEKNHEIHTLKREKSSLYLDLKSKHENQADEIQLLQVKQDRYQELIEDRDRRVEALAEKVRLRNQAYTKAEEQFNMELNAQTKLIELHKKASEDNQQRVQELMRAFEETQKLLKESNEAYEEMEKQGQKMEISYKNQLNEKQAIIDKLKDDLKKAKDAAQILNQDTVEKIFPIAAATSKVLHSGMTLTELYVEYIKAQEELQQQRSENASLAQELKNIVSEIEEKTPIINQRMQEYERSKDTISCLKNQLASALTDYEKLLEERNDAKRISNSFERENSRLKSQVLDLNRQVQVLLKEVEEARGGSISHNKQDEEVSSTNDMTADQVISRHLVTFRDIEEIQTKNQQLLTVIRELSEQHEELEKKVSTEITSKFEKEIKTLSMQLEEMVKSRAKQSEMLETIVRQRDMYRVLLTNQGFSESLLGQPGGSLSFSEKSPGKYSPGDPRIMESKMALNQLQVEFDNYKKEKNENERLLNEQLDQMRNDVSELRIQNAKYISQCEYSEERLKILQSNLDTYKKEYMSFKEKNVQLSSSIVQHQQTINTVTQDLMVAQEKLAKSEVTIENLKAERDLLKNVESRLLQEKESIAREQQHQTKLMANLQAVQNNLERIESESKRNLQYQVEKYEKENLILQAKLDNAYEELRSAVQVWEKQNKELQSKLDTEHERNQKLHGDLVDVYAQVHGLNQELLSTKAQLASTPEKRPPTDTTIAKTPQKSPGANVQASSEIKHLKEQLSEAQLKLKGLQEKLDLTSKSADQYSNMCRELELRLKEQDEINKQLKETMDSSLQSSNKAQTALEKSLEEMEKTNRELIEENMKLTQNSGSQSSKLQMRIAELERTVEDYKNQAEIAKKNADQTRTDCQSQIKILHEVQEKYERELILHAQDVKAISELKEEHQHCSLKIEKLTEAVKRAEQTLLESKESWARQEETLLEDSKALRKRIDDYETCNKNLHNQLDLMGTQMAALQSKNWNETTYSSVQSDLKDTQHLLQVIQFLKKDKEIACTQHDVAQSENIRLKLKVEQLTSELNETKHELKDLMTNTQAKAASDAQHSELLKKIEMMNLLSESNNMLRMEKDSLLEAKAKLEARVQDLEIKIQPLTEKEKELMQQIDMLSAESAALRIEVKNWQSRTNQLLEQSHRIGPQEYKNLMRDMEELKAQKTRLAEELQRKQAEISQQAANATSLKKELENAKAETKEKIQEVQKMTEDNAEHQKTLLQIKKIGRKYKTQYDELKVMYEALLAKSTAVESTNQEQVLQDLQKKVDEREKLLKELREEIEKHKESANEAKKNAETVLGKANEKEERAKKLFAQCRLKYSQMNGQKEALSEENKKLKEELEDSKNQLSTLRVSQEETLQNRAQADARISHLENELRKSKELRVSERDYHRKQYDELCQKMAQQKQTVKIAPGDKLHVSLGERSSGSEPLTANIKPLTSPSSSVRHSPHAVARPTPTASIRPMAISTTATPTQGQTRTATVLPTAHSEEQAPVSLSVPQAAVQPTPATATVAPTSVGATVLPVVMPIIVPEEERISEAHPVVHVAGSTAVSSPVTALVSPIIEATDSEPVAVDSPAPTTSVIVSPAAAQTQVVTPTVKRPRDESPNSSDLPDGPHKRVRMVSEGSQTNQPLPPASNVAIVSAAQVHAQPRKPSQEVATFDANLPSTSVQADIEDASVPASIPSLPSAACSMSEASESIVPVSETEEAEILDEAEKEQNIEWESQGRITKIEEDYEGEVMEEEPVDEIELDVDEQMQGIDARSPDDEDMAEEPQDEEEMVDQPTNVDLDLDSQMDADSSSLQASSTDLSMAPPAFVPSLDSPMRSEAPPAIESVATPVPPSSMSLLPPRQAPISRQHLTPFTIPGQGSNFEEGDDSIVPSTPTLYVPRRRDDGFAEAVSPHVPQVRFSFGSSESSPTQQGYSHSQLATQGALGMDDTRMDLFDEGNRTVPSTPLQVSPPAEATVPEVGEGGLESDLSNNDITVPVIKVDFVDEPDAAAAAASEDKREQPESTTPDTDDNVPEQESEKESGSDSTLFQIESEAKAEVSSESSQVTDVSKTEEVSTDSETQNKDTSGQMTSQRKPIVWKKQNVEAPTTEASENVPTSSTATTSTSLLPLPTRGRPRLRRQRFAGAAAGYARGRGSAPTASWPAPRRGRGSPRRRAMY